MFSALNQGSLVYILDKTNQLKYKVGEVVGISQPKFNTNANFTNPQNNTQTFVDIKIKIDGVLNEFNAIPSNYSLVTYNNGSIIISETKQGLQTEVEAILQNSKQILNNIDVYKNNIVECENILKDLNPQFAKDKERDDQINSLANKVSDMQSALDKIVNMLSKN